MVSRGEAMVRARGQPQRELLVAATHQLDDHARVERAEALEELVAQAEPLRRPRLELILVWVQAEGWDGMGWAGLERRVDAYLGPVLGFSGHALALPSTHRLTRPITHPPIHPPVHPSDHPPICSPAPPAWLTW